VFLFYFILDFSFSNSMDRQPYHDEQMTTIASRLAQIYTFNAILSSINLAPPLCARACRAGFVVLPLAATQSTLGPKSFAVHVASVSSLVNDAEIWDHDV
jgi:hypothetical protein